MSHDRPHRGGGGNQGYQGGDRRDQNRGPHPGQRGGDGGSYNAGGGYQRGGRASGEPQPKYQRSYVGKKRDREDETPEDPRKLFVSKLMKLCDPPPAGSKEPKEFELPAIEDAVKLVKRDLMHKSHTMSQVVDVLLDCATELSTKTHIYVLLIGLLNVEDGELGAQVLSALTSQLNTALASPCPTDHDRARLLLRTLACLATVNVAHPSAVVAVLEQLVGTALAAAKAGEDPSGHTWQPWSDWLVYAAVAVLPWAGAELAAACPAELTRMCDTVTEYLEARPIQSDSELRPFLQPIKDDDLAAKSDSGGSSFLPWLWAALSASGTAPGPAAWRVEQVPSLVEAAGLEGRLAVAQPQELPAVQVPTGPPQPPADRGGVEQGMEVEAGGATGLAVRATYLRKCYPPRGGVALLDTKDTNAGHSEAERFVAEELIIDTLMAFDADRGMCIKVLTGGMPMKWNYTPLLAEVIFGQLLCLPCSRLPLMAYATIMVDLCKFPKFEFPRSLSGCMRECFLRLEHMDPELSPRLVEFLAYHLSNFEYQWPWARWEWCAEEPESNPQRQFCQQLLSRLIRLSFHARIAKVLPPKFQELLGPSPVPPALPGESEAPAAAAAPAKSALPASEQQGGVNAAAPAETPADTEDGAGQGAQGGGAMEGVQDGMAGAEGNQMALDSTDDGAVPLSDTLAGEALVQVKARGSCDSLLAWVKTRGVEEALGQGPQGPLQVVMRAVLAAGSKSPSHLNAMLDRFAHALTALLEACPDRLAAQQMLLQQAADFYASLSQKVLMVVDRLLALRLISAAAVAHWTTGVALPKTLASGGSDSSSWEVLHYAIDRTAGRVHELGERRSKVLEEEQAARVRAADLSAQATSTWAQLRAHMREVRAAAAAQPLPQPPPAAPQVPAPGEEAVVKPEGQDGQAMAEDGSGAAAAGAMPGSGAGAGEQGAVAADVQIKSETAASDAEKSKRKQEEAMARVHALGVDELEALAQGDPRGRRLAVAARDAEMRAAKTLEKADSLATDAQAMVDAAGAAALEPLEALLVAYRGLAQLIALQQAAQEHEDAGEAAAADIDQERPQGYATARLERLTAQLRAFARRYACETAALAPRLAEALGSEAPQRVATALQEILHVNLLAS